MNVVGDASDVNTSGTDDCAPASDGDGDAKDVITAEESNQDEDSPVAASVQDENGQDTLINEEAFFSAPLGDGEDDTEVSADENKDTENEESGDDEDAFDISCPLADENTKVQSDKPAAKERRVDSLFDFIEIFVFTLAAVFIITSFFFRYSVVNGGSMKNTLMHDERLLLTNFLYTPDRGDIVVVQDKSTALKDPIVKRVIAIGGDTVKITKKAIFVNGTELIEDYVYTDDAGGDYCYSVYPTEALLSIVTGFKDGEYFEITVPENEIFVMGDHRNDSTDSRKIGTLHEDAIIGKVVLRFYPFENFGKVE